jgi:hypothetical protein
MLEDLENLGNNKPEQTGSGDRIQIIDVADGDEMHQLMQEHMQAKMYKAEQEKAMGRARRLYHREMIMGNRAQDRPKQFKLHGNVLGKDHTTTINVRENGYRALTSDQVARITAITGEQWVQANITKRTEASIDFTLVPADKQNAVAKHLLETNMIAGASVVSVETKHVPKSSYHGARTELSEENDALLEKINPMSCAFGR